MTKTIKNLNDHMLVTYHCLRYGIGILGIVFPFILYIGVSFANEPLQDSMSAYYCTVMRDVFVGILCSVGFGLILYKGFTYFEDWALNVAGIFVILAALIPTKTCIPSDKGIDWHLICAGLFFLFHAYVCIFRASDTLSLMQGGTLKNFYRGFYRIMGSLMFVVALLAFIRWSIGQQSNSGGKYIFFAEAAAVLIFGSYWIVKGFEIQKSTKVHQRLIKDRLYIEYGLRDILKLQICVKRNDEHF